jgi:hypothetical protein
MSRASCHGGPSYATFNPLVDVPIRAVRSAPN